MPDPEISRYNAAKIPEDCRRLASMRSRGNLGRTIAGIVLDYSPADVLKMKRNFGNNVAGLPADYREQLERKINEQLLGTYQSIRLKNQQGSFAVMTEPVDRNSETYWAMVEEQCRPECGSDDIRLRFLKFLLAGFCMLVMHEPGHPVGTPFPGGDRVERIDGIYYCPVRIKANDVDAALCPFCPAEQTPEIGYLKPPVHASEHRKQEFIEHCHRFHNFNG